MTQSWLITGPAGSGRSVVALAFAAALQCETHTGCGHCPGCEAVLARVHADLVIVSPEGLSIGIDDAQGTGPQGGHPAQRRPLADHDRRGRRPASPTKPRTRF